MSRRYVYGATYEPADSNDNVLCSLEVRITYGVSWGTPPSGTHNCPPENYDPGSGDELWIERVEIQRAEGDRMVWAEAAPEEREGLSTWLEGLGNDMLADAADYDQAERDHYDEMRWEEEREWQRFGR